MSGFDRAIVEIIDNVWQSVFDGHAVEEDPFRLAGLHARTFAGVVQISGAWDGAVAVQCGEDLVRRAAVAMFAIAPEAVSSAEMQDALGELANMVGGNFKALLPEPCFLSLPVTVEGDDFRLRLPNAAQVLQSAFRDGDDVFCVTVLQRVAVPSDSL
ncbi:MAG: chemotaxis protein CheX [Gemmatimonadetes bacterium]|nr:chemotaxis protein CheX [Gemmatimonadota bacterium]